LKLIVENLSVERGGRVVLAHLTEAFSGGEAVVLLGPNGTGKTTLLRAIAGLLKPSGGQIRLDHKPADGTSIGEHCHLVGHTNAVKTALTVYENAYFWASYHLDQGAERTEHGSEHGTVRGSERGVDVRQNVASALDRLGLSPLADIPARFLSAGQTRRLGLVRLFVAARPIWLLDEPTVSLDAASTKVLAAEIDSHVAAGGLAIAASHLPLGLASFRELRLNARAQTDELRGQTI
jgi:heme exporter protein A